METILHRLFTAAENRFLAPLSVSNLKPTLTQRETAFSVVGNEWKNDLQQFYTAWDAYSKEALPKPNRELTADVAQIMNTYRAVLNQVVAGYKGDKAAKSKRAAADYELDQKAEEEAKERLRSRQRLEDEKKIAEVQAHQDKIRAAADARRLAALAEDQRAKADIMRDVSAVHKQEQAAIQQSEAISNPASRQQAVAAAKAVKQKAVQQYTRQQQIADIRFAASHVTHALDLEPPDIAAARLALANLVETAVRN